MAKQIKVKGKTAFGVFHINANLSGLRGWATGVANFIADKEGAITQSLQSTLEVMQAHMLNRFEATKGKSRYVKATKGHTERSIMSGRVFGPDVMGKGKWFLKSYEERSIGDNKYILMQEKGWKRFTSKQPFLRVTDPDTGKTTLRPIKKSGVSFLDEDIVNVSVRHPRLVSRRFFLAGVTYWKTRGLKDFERRRLEIVRAEIRKASQ